MPTGYEYRCRQCGHAWLLFSKRFALGPPQWGETKYTCFNCQTFLSIAACLDRNSWSVWLRSHENSIAENATLMALAKSITTRLAKEGGLMPIEPKFNVIPCPTCHDPMSTVPFGEGLMKCPQCGQLTGEFDCSNGISSYG